MLTYFFVFGMVLHARRATRAARGFALYFLAGMLPWLAFSEAAGRAPTVMLEHRNFVKKLVFAVETLPVNLVVSGLVTRIVRRGAVLPAFSWWSRHGVPLTVLWLPVLLVPQMLFTAGVSWFLAALGVFVRDLGQIIGFLLTLWFFLTPICYPKRTCTAIGCLLLSKNPIYVLVRGYRAIFLEHHAPAFGRVVEAVAAVGGRVHPGARLVLQAAEIVRGYDLSSISRSSRFHLCVGRTPPSARVPLDPLLAPPAAIMKYGQTKLSEKQHPLIQRPAPAPGGRTHRKTPL